MIKKTLKSLCIIITTWLHNETTITDQMEWLNLIFFWWEHLNLHIIKLEIDMALTSNPELWKKNANVQVQKWTPLHIIQATMCENSYMKWSVDIK